MTTSAKCNLQFVYMAHSSLFGKRPSKNYGDRTIEISRPALCGQPLKRERAGRPVIQGNFGYA